MQRHRHQEFIRFLNAVEAEVRSEQLTTDQLQLGLEDLEQTVAANQAAQGCEIRNGGHRGTRSRRVPNLEA